MLCQLCVNTQQCLYAVCFKNHILPVISNAFKISDGAIHLYVLFHLPGPAISSPAFSDPAFSVAAYSMIWFSLVPGSAMLAVDPFISCVEASEVFFL